MRKGCPKCESKKIMRIPGNVGMYGSGNNIPAGMTIASCIKVTRYLCADCGFSEEWITNTEDLRKLKKKYGTLRTSSVGQCDDKDEDDVSIEYTPSDLDDFTMD